MAFVSGISIPDALRGAASRMPNDLPDTVRHRYRRVEDDRLLYRDARSPEPTIRDLGDHLSGGRDEPQVHADLVAIAQHRGWSKVMVWGAPEARRDLWFAARLADLEVVGYRPTRAQQAELDHRRDRLGPGARGPNTAASKAMEPRPRRGPAMPPAPAFAPEARRPTEVESRPPVSVDPKAEPGRRAPRKTRTVDEIRAPEPSAVNRISPAAPARSVAMGDVPARLSRRYFVDPRSGPGLGFHIDAQTPSAAFRDHGAQLSTRRSDPNVIRDLVEIAAHRGWHEIQIRGQTDFRRETWIVARAAGLEVRGYQPTSRDLQELARRMPPELSAQHDRGQAREAMTYNTIEAVVRQRVSDSATQARILSNARARLATSLERGDGAQKARQAAEMTR